MDYFATLLGCYIICDCVQKETDLVKVSSQKSFSYKIIINVFSETAMSDFKEETYSTIFTSLKHPVRRKILRILAQKTLAFSEILEILAIDSGHLSYHLEGIEDLLSKTKDRKYKLSFLGEAAVTTMINVEESPIVTSIWKPTSMWKPVITILIIGWLLLAGLVCVQYLSAEFHELDQENELLWNHYFSTLKPSLNSPPISKYEAIQKAIEYGNWNTTSLKGQIFDTRLSNITLKLKKNLKIKMPTFYGS